MTWSKIIRAARGELSQVGAAKALSGPNAEDACHVANVRNWEQGISEPPRWVQWQIVGTLMRAQLPKKKKTKDKKK